MWAKGNRMHRRGGHSALEVHDTEGSRTQNPEVAGQERSACRSPISPGGTSTPQLVMSSARAVPATSRTPASATSNLDMVASVDLRLAPSRRREQRASPRVDARPLLP